MNKFEFMKQLEAGLAKLPVGERNDILRDYEEHFAIGLEAGKSEEETCRSLGAPRQIVKEIMAMYHIEKIEQQPSTGNIFSATMAALGLGFLNLVFVLGPFMALVGIVIAGWAVGLSFVIILPTYFIGLIFPYNYFELFELFLCLTATAIGIFLLIGMKFATQSLGKLFVRYLKFNLSIVKRGYKNE